MPLEGHPSIDLEKFFNESQIYLELKFLVPIFFISDKHQSCTKKINFLSKKAESFQRSKSSKAVKRKVCSFCELRAWWKTSQGHLLTKIMSFQRSEASKALKSRLCSFCELPAWWKTSQGPLLTKTGSFQCSEAASKALKSRLSWFCELPASW